MRGGSMEICGGGCGWCHRPWSVYLSPCSWTLYHWVRMISTSFSDYDASLEQRWCCERHPPRVSPIATGPLNQSSWEPRAENGLTRGTRQPNRNQKPCKKMGSKSLLEPSAQLGKEGTPNQSPGKPRVKQGREKESGRQAPQNSPSLEAGWRTGKSETMLRRLTPIWFLGWRFPCFGRHLVSGWGFSIGWQTNRTHLQCQGPYSLHPRQQFSLILQLS
jgi:hypothetical protein